MTLGSANRRGNKVQLWRIKQLQNSGGETFGSFGVSSDIEETFDENEELQLNQEHVPAKKSNSNILTNSKIMAFRTNSGRKKRLPSFHRSCDSSTDSSISGMGACTNHVDKRGGRGQGGCSDDHNT